MRDRVSDSWENVPFAIEFSVTKNHTMRIKFYCHVKFPAHSYRFNSISGATLSFQFFGMTIFFFFFFASVH